MTRLPKYAKEKMKGNIGEAFVQYVLSQFCLVHSIDGSSDIGNDFICELIKGESPTNLLFYVQVKYHKREPIIRPELLEYWKGSPIPVFLFWVKDTPQNLSNQRKKKPLIFYKRYTPIVHNETKHNNEKFKPYDEIEFKKDLLKDYIRSLYKMGFTPVIRPGDFLAIDEKIAMGFKETVLFKDIASEYKNEILRQSWSNLFVTADLLKEKGDLIKAKQAIDLAYSLLEGLDAKEKYNFLELVNHERLEINRLSNLNSRE